MGIGGKPIKLKASDKTFRKTSFSIKRIGDFFTAKLDDTTIRRITHYELMPLSDGTLELTLKIEIPETLFDDISLSGTTRVQHNKE